MEDNTYQGRFAEATPEEEREIERMKCINNCRNDSKQPSPYHIMINGKYVDCYDLINALGITNPAQQHAFKKIAYAGNRGHKDFIKDLKEAAWSCNRAVELENKK